MSTHSATLRSIANDTGRWFVRLVLGALIVVVIAAAAGYAAARFYFWPRLDAMATERVVALEQRLGARVRWQHLSTDWQGLRPSFEVNGLVIGTGESALSIEKLAGTLSLLALFRGQWGLNDLRVDRPRMTLERDGADWRLSPLSTTTRGKAVAAEPGQLASEAGGWLAMIPDLRVGDATVIVLDPPSREGAVPGPELPLRLEGVNLVMRSHGRLHDLRLDVSRPGPLAGQVAIQADVLRPRGNRVSDWRNWEGTVMLQGRDADAGRIIGYLTRWAPSLAPAADAFPWTKAAGRLDPELRVAFRDGALIDGRLGLRSRELTLPVTSRGDQRVDLARLEADLRWRREPVTVGGGVGEGNAAGAGAGAGAGAAAGAGPATGDTTAGAGGEQWRVDVPLLVLRSRAGADAQQAVAITAGDRGLVARFAPGFSHLVQLDGELTEATLGPPFQWASGWLPALARAELAGRARQATFGWHQDGHWHVTGQIERATFALAPSAFELAHPKEPRIPGGRQIDLQIEATQAGGKATVSMPRGGQAFLTFGGIFSEPEIPFTELAGTVGWTVLAAPRAGQPLRLALDIDATRLANADAAGHAKARYVADETGHDGQLDVVAGLERGQARRVHRYLPQHLPQNVRDWVRQAFESGQLDQIQARVKGRLKAFPYQQVDEAGAGEFTMTGRFRDVLLRFAPDWPALQQASGTVGFDRATLRVTGERAEIGRSRVEGVTVAIDDLTHAELAVRGRVRGEAGDLLRFANASPLATSPVGAVTRPMRADGPVRLSLALDWALHDSRSHPRVSGQLDLDGTDLTFEDGQPTLAAVRGPLAFTTDALNFDRITASLHGSPIEASGRTEPGGALRVESRARISASSLRALTDNPLTRQLDGVAEVRTTMRFAEGQRTVEAESDLVGLVSHLPTPLAKPAAEARPLRFAWTPRAQASAKPDPATPDTTSTTSTTGTTSTPARPDTTRAGRTPVETLVGSIGDDVRFVAERSAPEAGRPMVITRAAVARGRAPVLPPRGLAIQVTVDRLDGDAWQEVFSDAPPSPSAATTPAASATRETGPLPRPAEPAGGNGLFAEDFEAEPVQYALAARDLRFGSRRYGDARVDGTRAGRLWQARLQATGVAGNLQWEQGGKAGPGGRLVGRFSRLALPPTVDGVTPALPTAANRLPALDITADDFAVGEARLGRLELAATNLESPPMWRLDRLTLTSPAATLKAVGRFRESTRLDYQLEIADAGKLLEQFGLKEVFRGGSGQMSGRAHWQSVPSNLDIRSLGGDLTVDVRNGQFLKADPGAAKLIGVLNLQALPKWLKLDFTDLFARGFAFQQLSGQVAIDNGVARADHLAMQGLEAVVQMKGEADLVRQTQDLQVTVLPHLDGSLAALAYAAIINPAVGLGAFVAQSLLGKQISKAFAYDFQVKGAWADPQVIEKKREEVPQQYPPAN